jgi:hypothetical protein
MTTDTRVQASIRNRLEWAVTRAGGEIRCIILCEADDAEFVKAETRYWRRRLKSVAKFWPTTFVASDGKIYHLLQGSGPSSYLELENGEKVLLP